ncbi:MAG: hypothetical protein AAGE01_12935 [Pseudomonadota bacterium]
MDTLNEAEARAIAALAGQSDHPLLMMNLNRYRPGAFPDSDSYRQWREVNAAMIGDAGGRILWTLPVHGHILSNGPAEPLDEILAYWYPSHAAFLSMRGTANAERNFALRAELIDFAIVHRCCGENPPRVPDRDSEPEPGQGFPTF